MRIVMWSGPRNLSTAMMYAFAARGDCAVWDEPFYAAYLKMTGLAHPMADQIVAAHDTDPARVEAACSGLAPDGKPHFYMKHMAHHMIDTMPMGWTEGAVHVHLIRHPARVIASYAVKREAPMLEDIGFLQQQTLFQRLGGIVIDSTDIRENPSVMLQTLCAEIGLDWTPEMLSWPAGGHADDGIWAAHWYGSVQQSTGFSGAEGEMPVLSETDQALCKRAMPAYEELYASRLMQK